MQNPLPFQVALAAGVGAFLGVAAGLLIGNPRGDSIPTDQIAHPAAAETPDSRSAETGPGLASEFRNLSSRIDVLIAEMRADLGQPARQPVTSVADSAVAHRLEEAAFRLEQLSRSPALTASRPNRLELPPLGVRPTPLPAVTPESRPAFEKSHVLRSYQDVIDPYGRPDSVWPNQDTINWTYEREDGETVLFTFQDGLVMRAGF